MGVAGQSRKHGLTARFAYYSFKKIFNRVGNGGGGLLLATVPDASYFEN